MKKCGFTFGWNNASWLYKTQLNGSKARDIYGTNVIFEDRIDIWWIIFIHIHLSTLDLI